MLSRGIYWDKKQNRKRHKFICPIRGSKKFAAKHTYCPWFHPQFVKGSGCYRYIRVDVDETIRQQIDYGSESFKKDFNRRTSSERIFSRLLSILMQEPTVKGLRATANLCTIAHITVLAVAYFLRLSKNLKEFGLLKVSFRIFNFVKPYLFTYLLLITTFDSSKLYNFYLFLLLTL